MKWARLGDKELRYSTTRTLRLLRALGDATLHSALKLGSLIGVRLAGRAASKA